jgi:hypothetical protein
MPWVVDILPGRVYIFLIEEIYRSFGKIESVWVMDTGESAYHAAPKE